MLPFKLLSFNFLLRKTLTMLTMLVKTIHCKTENDIGNIITNTVKRTCRNFNSFDFQQFSIFMNGNIEYLEYLQVLVVQRRFCQLQINSPVMASLYIYKLKVNAKLQEKNYSKARSVNPLSAYRELCQSPKPQLCF